MALDSNRGVRWVFDTLHDDVTLQGLLGGTKVYRRRASRGATTPFVVVALYSTRPPIGAIRTGHNTHSATPITVRTSVWDEDNSALIEQIGDRITVLLDGKSFQPVAGGGEVLCCIKTTDIERPPSNPDDNLVGWDILWDIDVKA